MVKFQKKFNQNNGKGITDYRFAWSLINISFKQILEFGTDFFQSFIKSLFVELLSLV